MNKIIYKIPQENKKIWWEAMPYQDARNDRGHAFIVTVYAQHICEAEKTNKDVVVPAAMLHDIGWSQFGKKERMLIFDKTTSKEERLKMRYKHQDEGVKLADRILKKLNYPSQHVEDILEIVSQHDTREGYLNKNEGAVRDADKLWRLDRYGFLNDNQNSGITFKDHFEYLKEHLANDDFLYFDSSREWAFKLLKELKKIYSD